MIPSLALLLLACALLGAMLPAPVLAGDSPRPPWDERLAALAKRDGYRLITAPQARALMAEKGGKLAILDARTSYEYEAGHLPGAVNLEFDLADARGLSPEKEKKLRALLGPDLKRPVVVYDRGLQCVRSQMAAQWAVNLGYSDVWHLARGWMGWVALTQTGGQPQPAGPKAGDPFPAGSYALLDPKHDRAYLGLAAGAARVELGQIKGQIILVELFHQLCSACRDSLPLLERLQQKILADPKLAGRVKLIGLGVGSDNRQVHHFQGEHKVAFPLMADPGRRLHKALGSPVLPVIYALAKQPGGGMVIRQVSPGPWDSLARLLELVRQP